MEGPDPDDPFVRDVERKSQRMVRARRARAHPLHGMLAAIGVGWSVVLPAVGAGILGALIERRYGYRYAAIAGVCVGLAIGIYVGYRQVRRALEDDGPERPDDDEAQKREGESK